MKVVASEADHRFKMHLFDDAINFTNSYQDFRQALQNCDHLFQMDFQKNNFEHAAAMVTVNLGYEENGYCSSSNQGNFQSSKACIGEVLYDLLYLDMISKKVTSFTNQHNPSTMLKGF